MRALPEPTRRIESDPEQIAAIHEATIGLLEPILPERPHMDGGLIAYANLPLDQATDMLARATAERVRRRKLKVTPAPSPAELDLIAALLYIGGKGFTLQHPLGPYDADIYFEPELLVVEVDGAEHHSQRTQQDRRRDLYLKMRFRIETVRIPASHVWQDPIRQAKHVAANVGRRRRQLTRDTS